MADRVFILEVDGQAVAAFEAASRTEANQLRQEQWLRDDLSAWVIEGEPIWRAGSAIVIRHADETEMALYQDARSKAKPSDDLFLAYLI